MAKEKSIWVCSECGSVFPKWSGQCSACHSWNTIEEEIKVDIKNRVFNANTNFNYMKPLPLKKISMQNEPRYKTNIKEFDRVLGSGIVKGSLVLLGGDPGIGKSTILLQVCEKIGPQYKVLYVSAEESINQLKLRAERLNINAENLYIMAQTDIECIVQEINIFKPNIVIIDSIQTLNYKEITSSSGSVSQVKECTNILMRIAKQQEISIIIVGHVNKEGGIAGPKVLEHIVDTVLYFEGDRHMSYRLLRGIKNRYGSTNEIGVFKMENSGLIEVENPSLMLLSERPSGASGTCVCCLIEGTRPIFAEVQALAASTNFGNPRRMTTGFDYNRLSMILAVLEKKAGYFFSNLDTYINVIGGIKLEEPAADLAVAAALISSLKNIPIANETVAFGEIGLAGELRGVSHVPERIKEAQRLGFKRCVIPKNSLELIKNSKEFSQIEIIGASNIKIAFEALL